eukprot:TRINITY_DN32144_c0_g1_i1.p1 TRINITY_DN32144_c0_g1~~TRINITY_DN32144_c0_g1_i1.p1  ORF type:complete len:391 (+),score=101.25 TRINITY_DN32144_c0_g1_i1:60-1175(+)
MPSTPGVATGTPPLYEAGLYAAGPIAHVGGAPPLHETEFCAAGPVAQPVPPEEVVPRPRRAAGAGPSFADVLSGLADVDTQLLAKLSERTAPPRSPERPRSGRQHQPPAAALPVPGAHFAQAAVAPTSAALPIRPSHVSSSGLGSLTSAQVRLVRDTQGRLRVRLKDAPHGGPEDQSEPELLPGQEVEATKDLVVMRDGKSEVVAPKGSVGVVQGLPPALAAQGRTSVSFMKTCPDFSVNVLPDEVSYTQQGFDRDSLSVETHLARLLWEGRDRFASVGGEGRPGVSPVQQRRLMRFFERYNPHRLPSVRPLLVEFAGREDVLFTGLVKRYGPEPPDASENLPPGWSLVRGDQGDLYYKHANGARQWHKPG